MNCEALLARLQDFLDGKLPAAVRLEVETHLAECRDCAALARLMTLDPPAEGAPDLTGDVLERTSGPACDRAREILCDVVDGDAEAIDADLLRPHVDDCEACATFAVALERLHADLPAMAELAPAPGFVREVLAATLPPRNRRDAFADRCRQAWTALASRPRIAWEASYLGAVAVWLVVSVLGVPLQTAAALPEVNLPVAVVEDLTDRVTSLGQQAWAATGERGAEGWNGLQSDLSSRYRHTEPARDAMQDDGERLKEATLSLDWKESRRALKAITTDAREVWERFADGPDPGSSNDADN